MKSLLLSLSFFIAISVLFSCGGDDDSSTDGPKPSTTYYLKFKADGVWKVFETDEPGYQSCGDCACSSIPPLGTDYGDINVCQDANDWITAANIESWENTSIEFTGSGFPIASFYYTETGTEFLSENATSQAGSTVTITSVSSDGDFVGKLQYKVKGTFQCHVRSDIGTTDIAITEGSFVVRYSED